MKKKYLAFLVALTAQTITAQIFISKDCEISFFSATPMEDISAVNTASKVILNTSTNEIQAKVPVVNFKFKKSLMEEHFNENYMETEKYPNSTFKGKIKETIDFSKDGEYDVTVLGKMNMHGIEKETTLTGKLIIKNGEISLNTKFNIHLADYNIKIPSVVSKNIAEDIEVKLNSNLIPFKK